MIKSQQPNVLARIPDIKELGLPQNWEFAISQQISENRLNFEPFIETATSYAELREKLMDRGYSNIPTGVPALVDFGGYNNAPTADVPEDNKVKTMIRKKT